MDRIPSFIACCCLSLGWIAWIPTRSPAQDAGATESMVQIVTAALAQASGESAESRESLEALMLVDAWEPSSRHRFFLPQSSARRKLAADRFAQLLDRLRIRDEVEARLEARLSEAEERMQGAIEAGETAAAYRWRWRIAGLQSILPTRTRRVDWQPSLAIEGLRVSRSSVPFPLLAWGAGTFAVAKTPHFAIVSQANERTTAEMAFQCEALLAVWKQLFYESWATEQIVAPEFSEPEREPFRVVLFRNRESYVRALKTLEPRIGISTGYYSPQHRMAFFFWDPVKSLPTLAHELTHQFFQEATRDPPTLDTDRDPGFWLVEGLALYVESFSQRPLGGAWAIDVGGWDAQRLQAARYRRLHDQMWIPWEEMHGASGAAFRKLDDLPAWYSQACGLAHRWLDGSRDDRRRFLKYAQQVYAGRGGQASGGLELEDDAMREDYDRYLLESWDVENPEAGERVWFPQRREAVLARCQVTSRHLLAWPAGCRELDWLDLSFTPVDDAWLLDAGSTPWDVVRLNLESTQVTDTVLPILAAMPSLTELDLTHTAITDAGLAAFQDHPRLRRLWLGGTRISDASAPVLESMKRLEKVVVDGSDLPEATWQTLLKKHPAWRN